MAHREYKTLRPFNGFVRMTVLTTFCPPKEKPTLLPGYKYLLKEKETVQCVCTVRVRAFHSL